jgi:hypothetical protein
MGKDLQKIWTLVAALMKRIMLHGLAGITVNLVLMNSGLHASADYPSHPVQMIIPFAAGGPTDIVGRIMAAKMGELLGQQFVVENRSGAGGNIGAETVAKASPDGYTILMATVSTNAINPGLYKHMPYDAVRDFAPLGRIGVTPTLLLVNPSIPASDVKSLIALIEANPGKYNYGSSGVGSILHLCGEDSRRWPEVSTSRTCPIRDQRRWILTYWAVTLPWHSTRRRLRCHWRNQASCARSVPGWRSACRQCQICRHSRSRV